MQNIRKLYFIFCTSLNELKTEPEKVKLSYFGRIKISMETLLSLNQIMYYVVACFFDNISI